MLCAGSSSFLFSLLRFLELDFPSPTDGTCNLSFSCVKFIPLCVFAPLRGHALSQVAPISALAMKSHRRDLWPAAKPFPQHQPHNKHGAACSCAGACLHNFTSLHVFPLFRCVWYNSKLCMRSPKKLTADWNSARRPVAHAGTQLTRLLHRFQTWISDFFFHPPHLRVYEPGQDRSSHRSDLLPSHGFWVGGRSDKNGLLSFEMLHLFRHMYEHKGLIIYIYLQPKHN